MNDLLNFFLNNESTINFTCWLFVVCGVLLNNIFQKHIQVMIEIYTTLCFYLAFINVIINGIYKGF